MAAVYEAATANIEIMHNSDINNLSWTVTNEDTTPYDFSNLTDINMNIYDRKGGALLLTRPQNATNGLQVASNVISWKDDWPSLSEALLIRSYYYEIVYEDSATTHPTIKVVEGVLTIL